MPQAAMVTAATPLRMARTSEAREALVRWNDVELMGARYSGWRESMRSGEADAFVLGLVDDPHTAGRVRGVDQRIEPRSIERRSLGRVGEAQGSGHAEPDGIAPAGLALERQSEVLVAPKLRQDDRFEVRQRSVLDLEAGSLMAIAELSHGVVILRSSLGTAIREVDRTEQTWR